ncbi:MAG: hypothetical protein LH679_09200 [Cyanobacteria bacterium CAN_BIN43]|nr:hypothetical protein [Cyanobacteria bacterium CAN_BIN43]
MSTNNRPILNDTLFTDLTPEQAETVDGGGKGSFTAPIRFDSLLNTRSFSSTGLIGLFSDTRSSDPTNKIFFATLINSNTGRAVSPAKLVYVGRGGAIWSGMPWGRHFIRFSDTKDGVSVSGNITVSHGPG